MDNDILYRLCPLPHKLSSAFRENLQLFFCFLRQKIAPTRRRGATRKIFSEKFFLPKYARNRSSDTSRRTYLHRISIGASQRGKKCIVSTDAVLLLYHILCFCQVPNTISCDFFHFFIFIQRPHNARKITYFLLTFTLDKYAFKLIQGRDVFSLFKMDKINRFFSILISRKSV